LVARSADISNEAFARVKIDALLAAQGRDVLDTNAVRFEVQLPDGTRADNVLAGSVACDLAVHSRQAETTNRPRAPRGFP
jgi:type I restriction enzyme R subunit